MLRPLRWRRAARSKEGGRDPSPPGLLPVPGSAGVLTASPWPLPLQPLHLRLRQEEGAVKGKEGAGRVSMGTPARVLPTVVGSHGAVHPLGTSSLGAWPCVPEATSQCILRGPGATPYLAPARNGRSPRVTPPRSPSPLPADPGLPWRLQGVRVRAPSRPARS